MKVCLSVSTLNYPQGGGHRWVFLNWALGLQCNGCEVTWLDAIDRRTSAEQIEERLKGLRAAISPYGFGQCICLSSREGTPLPSEYPGSCLPLEAAYEADLLLNFNYDLVSEEVRRFRRSALVDLDPGILQINLANGSTRIGTHDCYFSIGETVGTPGAGFPDAGLRWQHTKPCVAVDYWPVARAEMDAPFTTVTHWWMDEWIVMKNDVSYYRNDKRSGFKPFLSLPRIAPGCFELALALDGDSAEQVRLEKKGWRVRDAHKTAGTTADFQTYVQQSKGEFSCCKPAYAKLQTGWVSDRTLCYLASGKPAIVQDTGSRYLPNAAGLFRFRTLEEAKRQVEIVSSDYERQCELARSVALEHFSAERVVRELLNWAVG